MKFPTEDSIRNGHSHSDRIYGIGNEIFYQQLICISDRYIIWWNILSVNKVADRVIDGK